jgi:hypothetical protein
MSTELNNEAFGTEIDFDSEFNGETPKITNEGLKDGKYLVLIIPSKTLEKDGSHKEAEFKSKKMNPVPTGKTGLFQLNMMLLKSLNGAESHDIVEIIPVIDAQKNIVGYNYSYPKDLKNMLRIEFMNDNMLDIQFKKDSFAEGFDAKMPSGHLSYNKIAGKIGIVKFETTSYDSKTEFDGEGKAKKKYQQGVSFVKNDRPIAAGYQISFATDENGNRVPFSKIISDVPAISAINLLKEYNTKKDELKAAKDESGATENLPEVAEGTTPF